MLFLYLSSQRTQAIPSSPWIHWNSSACNPLY
jgi:hypothetical protein